MQEHVLLCSLRWASALPSQPHSWRPSRPGTQLATLTATQLATLTARHTAGDPHGQAVAHTQPWCDALDISPSEHPRALLPSWGCPAKTPCAHCAWLCADGLHPRQGLGGRVPAGHIPQASQPRQPGADKRDMGLGCHAPAAPACLAVCLCQGLCRKWTRHRCSAHVLLHWLDRHPPPTATPLAAPTLCH